MMSKYYRVTHTCTTCTWEVIEASNTDEAEEKYGDGSFLDGSWYADQGKMTVEEIEWEDDDESN